jgi:hypothetical protein
MYAIFLAAFLEAYSYRKDKLPGKQHEAIVHAEITKN